MRAFNSILVTGGAGFIGSHVVRKLLTNRPDAKVVNLDALTYAGNLENLRDVESNPHYAFVKGDIQDSALIERLFAEHAFDAVVHLAAESHVDRSIENPMAFLETNILGPQRCSTPHAPLGLMRRAIAAFTTSPQTKSTVRWEPKGSSPKKPRTIPAALQLLQGIQRPLVRAWHHTYGMPVVLSNCSNNYGAYQFPEKLIPLMIRNIRDGRPLPVYGEGINVRDWLWVEDHASAIDVILHTGNDGRTYNIGGLNEWKNIDLVHELIRLVDAALGRPEGHSKNSSPSSRTGLVTTCATPSTLRALNRNWAGSRPSRLRKASRQRSIGT